MAYLQRAKGYADSLASIGEPVRPKDLVLTILAGLSGRHEVNSLVTTLTARGTDIHVDDLQALLADHEFVHGRSKSGTPNIAQAYNVQMGQPMVPSRSLNHNVTNSPNYVQLAAQAQSLGLTLVPTGTPPQSFFGNRQSSNNGYRAGSRGGRGRNTNRNTTTRGGKARGP